MGLLLNDYDTSNAIKRLVLLCLSKETLIKFLLCHAGEYQHPVGNGFDWILATPE